MKTILIEIQIRDLISLKPLLNKIHDSAIKGVEIGRGAHGDASFVYRMSYHEQGNYKEKNLAGIKQKIYFSKMNKTIKK
jgi:YD repeat-containing protein